MKASTALIRTGSGSVPVQPPVRSGSIRTTSLSRQDSFTGLNFFGGDQSRKSMTNSPKLEMNHRRISGIRRALSDSDLIKSESGSSTKLKRAGSQYFPSGIPEEDYVSDVDLAEDDHASIISKNDRVDCISICPENSIPIGFSDDGFVKSSNGEEDKSKIGEYYREMLKSNPTDPLLLRNYGKFLHEVEKDTKGAEEYYGRAILASPGDGEVLSLYGNLIWTTQRDEERAKVYFDQAIHASPNDCSVLGSYARFMWEAEEEEEEEVEDQEKAEMSPAMVAAF